MGKTLYLFLSKFLPSCKEVARLASESCERPLTFKERMLMKMKCMICIYSDRYVKQIDQLHSQIGEQSECSEEAVKDVCFSEDKKEAMKRMLNS